SAAAAVTRIEMMGPKLVVESATSVGVAWKGPAIVDGLPWPAADDQTLWLPPGPHAIEHALVPPASQSPRLLYLNADLKSAHTISPSTIEFSYQSASRAIAILDRPAKSIQIDGASAPLTLLFPRGQHVITITTGP